MRTIWAGRARNRRRPPRRRATRDLNLSHADLAWLLTTRRERGRTVLRVHGASMLPAIPAGSLVTLESPGAEPPRAGEIVASWSDDRLRIHRVRAVDLRRGTVQLQGDSCSNPDPPLRLAQILARVIDHRPPSLGWSLRQRLGLNRRCGPLGLDLLGHLRQAIGEALHRKARL